MANEAPKSFDFTAHDKQFHGGRFVDGKMKCKFRDQIKKYEATDRLDGSGSGVDYSKFKDDAENCESLEALIAKVSTPEMKKYLTAMLAKCEAKLEGTAALSTATGAVSQHKPARIGFGPNKPLEHDDSAFPSGAAWETALADYGSGYWYSAGSGSTEPHYIDFNGKRYFVKKAGFGKSTYTEEAAQNEVNANNFIRLAGFNAPDSKYYDTPAGQFAVSLGQDLGKTLNTKIGRDKDIDEEVRSAYPLMSLMYNMDLMQNSDNAFIGSDGKPLFLDNGSTFGFSAQGARNKYYDFDKRNDPFPSTSISGGLMGLLDVGNNSSRVWGNALGSHADKESILKQCAKYEMGDLVREAKKQGLLDHLPKKGVKALEEYADKLDDLSKKYKSAPEPAKQQSTQPASSTVQAQSIPSGGNNSAAGAGSDTGNQSALQQLASKYGIAGLTTTNNANGTMTLGGLGSVSQQNLIDFVSDLNKSGLIPGFVASLTQGGQIQTTQAITQNAFSSFASMNHVGTGVSAVSGITSMPSGGYGISLSSSISGNSRVVNSMAKWINSSNSFPGYTANAVQNPQTGGWEITLYPTGSVQQTQQSSSSASGSPQTITPSSSPRSSSGRTGTTSAQQPSVSTPTSVPSQPPTPVQASTQNNQQSTAPTSNAHLNMLIKRASAPGTPVGLKAKYIRKLNAASNAGIVPQSLQSQVSSLIASAPSSASQTGTATGSVSQPQNSSTLSAAANALIASGHAGANRINKRLARLQPGTQAYQTAIANLNKMASIGSI